jgi:short-subunit dehydrogenase
MNALITGATSGIGKEIAYLLGKQGINLILASRNVEKMKSLVQELSKSVKVDFFEIDLSKQNSAQKLYDLVKEKGLQVDILVNNSGYGLYGRNSDQDINMLEQMIILNAASLTSLCRLFSSDMILNKSGYILNVASTAAFQPIPYFAAYSASKSYVMNFSKAIHHELKNSGVGVTCLNPGPTETNFFEVALSGNRFELFKGKPMMSAKEVAEIGIKAMFNKKTVVTAGLFNVIFSKITHFVPLSLIEFVLRKYVKQ